MYFPVEVSKIFSGNGVAKGEEADRKPVKGSAAAITKTVPTQENQRQSETAINTYMDTDHCRGLHWAFT